MLYLVLILFKYCKSLNSFNIITLIVKYIKYFKNIVILAKHINYYIKNYIRGMVLKNLQLKPKRIKPLCDIEPISPKTLKC